VLPRIVGERRAKEVILAARSFSMAEACAWVIVNRICSGEALVGEAVATARHIAGNAPLSVHQARRAIRFGLQVDLASGMVFEREAYYRLLVSEDRNEGLAAFKEKRPARFSGR
jgi:enoyl-CoA hydratase/carnithine racemase